MLWVIRHICITLRSKNTAVFLTWFPRGKKRKVWVFCHQLTIYLCNKKREETYKAFLGKKKKQKTKVQLSLHKSACKHLSIVTSLICSSIHVLPGSPRPSQTVLKWNENHVNVQPFWIGTCFVLGFGFMWQLVFIGEDILCIGYELTDCIAYCCQPSRDLFDLWS